MNKKLSEMILNELLELFPIYLTNHPSKDELEEVVQFYESIF